MITNRFGRVVNLLQNRVKRFDSAVEVIENIDFFGAVLRDVVIVVEIAARECNKTLGEKISYGIKLDEAVKLVDKIMPFKSWICMADGKTLPILISLTVSNLKRELGEKWSDVVLRSILEEGGLLERPHGYTKPLV
jgi:hypothetical protein